ncbi:MAG TPA: PRC-barrel domain-containing protein [Elusimicrobiota bacterium]|nr:PRC-barrel domain-containing protein [Elusimicrobiota bacterium]
MTVPDRSYRVSDLDGCHVVTESGEVLGTLKDVYPTGANDVFVVVGAREYLIPAMKETVLEIDVSAKRILVRLPPGLREIYET